MLDGSAHSSAAYGMIQAAKQNIRPIFALPPLPHHIAGQPCQPVPCSPSVGLCAAQVAQHVASAAADDHFIASEHGRRDERCSTACRLITVLVELPKTTSLHLK